MSCNTLSEDHPLCAPACSVAEQATRLAQIHSRLRTGAQARAAEFVLHTGHSLGLAAVPNHQGRPCWSKSHRSLTGSQLQLLPHEWAKLCKAMSEQFWGGQGPWLYQSGTTMELLPTFQASTLATP